MTEQFERHLEGIDQERREAILKLVRVAAFAVPAVASFSIDGRVAVAHAMASNTTMDGPQPLTDESSREDSRGEEPSGDDKAQ